MSSSSSILDTSQLPSVKLGMSEKEEAMKRRKTCRFIEEVGRVLKLPRVAIATSMVMFHRFYAKHSFQEHDRFEVAVASILLAAKTEESPKKLHVVMEEAYKVKIRGMQSGRMTPSTTAGGSSSTQAGMLATTSTGGLDPKGEEFVKLKERILLLERVILHTIGFELSIDHPYKFLVDIIKKLVHRRSLEFIDTKKHGPSSGGSGDTGGSTAHVYNKMLNVLVQYAMNLANDSMQTSLCLQFEPYKIATACVYLSGQFAKVRPSDPNQTWLDLLQHPNVEALVCIALQIIELVSERKGSPADQSMFEQIRKDLELLKEEEEKQQQNLQTPRQPPSVLPGTVGEQPQPPSVSSTTDGAAAADGSSSCVEPDAKKQKLS